MSRTITITLDDAAYERLQEQFGHQPVVEVIQNLLRPYTLTKAELDGEYAAMAADTEREMEALEWIESAPDDSLGEEHEDWSWLKQR
jgi:predicted CopG family antitoxin